MSVNKKIRKMIATTLAGTMLINIPEMMEIQQSIDVTEMFK